MSNKWMFILGGFLVTVIVVAGLVAALKIDVTPAPVRGKAVVRTRNFGEGIKISRHGIYGVDLVSIGRAHMRKLRKGPFTIGAINELVLEDVALVLPEEVWRGAQKDEKGSAGATEERAGAGAGDNSKPRAMLARLGIKADNIKMGEKIPRFSALMIRQLRVSRLVGTRVEPWFVAQSAKAERSGLALKTGWSVEGGVTNQWSEALLVVEPQLRIFPAK